ncbi:WD40 repeat-containing protein [Planoprotostelium fungivorum]|uniref:WD40 repeat-containing protein n=1 Tax=Planoprotostelium fungivorum TaxID=1890364 RepID=A0A2P6N4U6_9EUKA|nr:WD40 repeat-containing protein [Planoprotostelium fungivorum]
MSTQSTYVAIHTSHFDSDESHLRINALGFIGLCITVTNVTSLGKPSEKPTSVLRVAKQLVDSKGGPRGYYPSLLILHLVRTRKAIRAFSSCLDNRASSYTTRKPRRETSLAERDQNSEDDNLLCNFASKPSESKMDNGKEHVEDDMNSLSDDEEHAFMETESELESMGIGIIVEREGEEEEEGQQEASNMEDVDDSESAFEGHTDSVYSVDVATFNGTQIAASGGGDDKAFLWDMKTGQTIKEFTGHTDTVSCVKFNVAGNLLATASYDCTVKVWNVADGTLIKSIEGPSEGIEWLTWHTKGNIILAGSSDASCWMWTSAGQCMGSFHGHGGAVNTGLFTSDGKTIVTGSSDATVRVWDPKTSQCTHTFQGQMFHQADILSLSSSPQNPAILLTGSMDTGSKLVNVSNGKILGSFDGHEDAVESVSLCAAFPFAATGSLDKKVNVWDINTLQLRTSGLHEEGVVKVQWHPTSPHILLTSSLDKSVKLWDCRTGDNVKTLRGHKNVILDMAITADGKYAVTSSDDQAALLYALNI